MNSLQKFSEATLQLPSGHRLLCINITANPRCNRFRILCVPDKWYDENGTSSLFDNIDTPEKIFALLASLRGINAKEWIYVNGRARWRSFIPHKPHRKTP